MYSSTFYYDNVGYCYEEGVGVEQDYAKAAEYYELATKSNSGMAWYDLGRMYEEGLVLSKILVKHLNVICMRIDIILIVHTLRLNYKKCCITLNSC